MIHKLNVTQIDWFSYFVMHLLFFLIKLSVTESHFLYSVLSDDPTFPNLFGIDDNFFPCSCSFRNIRHWGTDFPQSIYCNLINTVQ